MSIGRDAFVDALGYLVVPRQIYSAVGSIDRVGALRTGDAYIAFHGRKGVQRLKYPAAHLIFLLWSYNIMKKRADIESEIRANSHHKASAAQKLTEFKYNLDKIVHKLSELPDDRLHQRTMLEMDRVQAQRLVERQELTYLRFVGALGELRAQLAVLPAPREIGEYVHATETVYSNAPGAGLETKAGPDEDSACDEMATSEVPALSVLEAPAAASVPAVEGANAAVPVVDVAPKLTKSQRRRLRKARAIARLADVTV